MTVKAAKQIAQALEKYHNIHPDLVFIDTIGGYTGQPGWVMKVDDDWEWLGRNLQEALTHITGVDRDEIGRMRGDREWTSVEGWVYLLHFDRPIGTNSKTAQHYLGYTSKENIEERLTKHQLGQGAAIMDEAYRQGIGFTIVRKWRGNRLTEKQLKRSGHLPRKCWICQHSGQGQDKRRKYYQAVMNVTSEP